MGPEICGPQPTLCPLLGKWKEVQFATDDNDNGILDASELHNVAQGYISYLTFNKDSSGTESITANDSTINYPFKWVFKNNDTFQRAGLGHDTITYDIVNITALSLQMQTTTNRGVVWYVYNKL